MIREKSSASLGPKFCVTPDSRGWGGVEEKGSSLSQMGRRQIELSAGEVDHGDQVAGGSVAAGLGRVPGMNGPGT